MESDICSNSNKGCSCLLVRHGCTEYNVEKRLQGWIDTPINALGRKQVQELIKSLKKMDKHWDVIVSSDLMRARQTAAIIGKTLNIPIFLCEGLRERCYGSYEGKFINEVKKLREVDHSNEMGLEQKDIFTERVIKAFNSFYEVFNGQRIIVVSHGAALKNFCKITFGYDKEKWENYEIAEVVYSNGKWIRDL